MPQLRMYINYYLSVHCTFLSATYRMFNLIHCSINQNRFKRYGTDHTQRRIRSRSRICSRLNNYRLKAWHLFRSRVSLNHTQEWMLTRKTGATSFFLVIIKLRAQVNATLCVICTVHLQSNSHYEKYKQYMLQKGSHYVL